MRAKWRGWRKVGQFGHVRWEVRPNGCWQWLLTIQSSGYASTYFQGRTMTAHRAAWIDRNGPIPPGLHLHHRCKNRLCVNPGHMELLTPKQHAERHAEDRKVVGTFGRDRT